MNKGEAIDTLCGFIEKATHEQIQIIWDILKSKIEEYEKNPKRKRACSSTPRSSTPVRAAPTAPPMAATNLTAPTATDLPTTPPMAPVPAPVPAPVLVLHHPPTDEEVMKKAKDLLWAVVGVVAEFKDENLSEALKKDAQEQVERFVTEVKEKQGFELYMKSWLIRNLSRCHWMIYLKTEHFKTLIP